MTSKDKTPLALVSAKKLQMAKWSTRWYHTRDSTRTDKKWSAPHYRPLAVDFLKCNFQFFLPRPRPFPRVGLLTLLSFSAFLPRLALTLLLLVTFTRFEDLTPSYSDSLELLDTSPTSTSSGPIDSDDIFWSVKLQKNRIWKNYHSKTLFFTNRGFSPNQLYRKLQSQHLSFHNRSADLLGLNENLLYCCWRELKKSGTHWD